MLSLLLMLLTQISVTATGMTVSQTDVDKILDPLVSWFSSLSNVIVAFASVIIVVWFIKLLARKIGNK